MGGFMAVQGAAADSAVLAAGLISAAHLRGRIPQPLPKEREPAPIQALSAGFAREGMAPLSGCTREGLARETIANGAKRSFESKTDALKSRPVLVITSDDGLAPANTAFAAALRKAGNSRATTLHLPTDHSYFRSTHRPFHGGASVARNPAIGIPPAPVNWAPDGRGLRPNESVKSQADSLCGVGAVAPDSMALARRLLSLETPVIWARANQSESPQPERSGDPRRGRRLRSIQSPCRPGRDGKRSTLHHPRSPS
jgi:hypothetical protein